MFWNSEQVVCWMPFLRTYWLFMWQECCVNIIDQDRQFATLKAVLRKKVLHKKPVFGDLANFSICKTVLWLNFLVHFLHFWNQYEKKEIFLYPIRNIWRNKVSCLRRDNGYFFENLKVKNARNRSIFLKNFFNKQVSDFHSPFKILCHTSKLWIVVKVTATDPYSLYFKLWQLRSGKTIVIQI
jgi:hypothetical protein